MQKFYQRFLNDQQSAQQALRETQDSLKTISNGMILFSGQLLW
jgi:CHAT domain-containing protein